MWTWIIPALVLVPVLAVVSALLAGHAWFAQYHRHKGIALRRASIGEHLAYYLREGMAHFVLAAWHIRALGSEGLQNADGSGRPVLLVHGITQNATNLFGLRRGLEREGHPTWAVSLGRPLRPIEAYARTLAGALRAAVDRYPDGVDVVAHSMGGLVLRHVLAEHPDLACRVGRVVTLGAPHRGTASSRGFPALACDVGQMKRRSAWLAALPVFAPHIDVVTVAAERDFVVYPSTSCHLPGARRVDLAGIGHAGLLTDRRVQAAVLATLDSAPAVAAQALQRA